MDRPGRAHRYFAGMRCQQAALAFVVLGLLSSSCRKDKDEQAPTIQFLSPVSGVNVVIPDTITVSVEVSDNEEVTNVTFSVVNAQGFPVSSSISVEPGTNPATITVQLPLTSDLILSGDHEVKVVASDGTNRTTSARSITMSGLPRRLRGIYLLTQPASDQVSVQWIDSAGVLGTVTNVGQDLNCSAVSSHGQRIFLGGGTVGPLTALHPDGSVQAQLAGSNTLSIPFFTALHVGPTGSVFVATNDGQLRRLNKDLGGTGYQAQAVAGHRILQIVERTDQVLTAQSAIASAEERLVSYSSIGGVQTDVWMLDKVPVALFERDADHVLLFGNRNGGGVVEDRNTSDGGFWEPRTFPDPIEDVAQVSSNIYILATGSELIRFTYNNAGALTIASGNTFEHLAYNEVSGELIATDGTEVFVLDPASGTVLNTYTLPGEPQRPLVLYNR